MVFLFFLNLIVYVGPLFHWWGLSVFDFFVALFCLYFLHFICKHFVKMYILGKLFLYAHRYAL